MYWHLTSGDALDTNDDPQVIKERQNKIIMNGSTGGFKLVSVFATLTDSTLMRARRNMSNAYNELNTLTKIDEMELSSGYRRMLKHHCWLNDENINIYTILLVQHNEALHKQATTRNGGVSRIEREVTSLQRKQRE